MSRALAAFVGHARSRNDLDLVAAEQRAAREGRAAHAGRRRADGEGAERDAGGGELADEVVPVVAVRVLRAAAERGVVAEPERREIGLVGCGELPIREERDDELVPLGPLALDAAHAEARAPLEQAPVDALEDQGEAQLAPGRDYDVLTGEAAGAPGQRQPV